MVKKQTKKNPMKMEEREGQFESVTGLQVPRISFTFM